MALIAEATGLFRRAGGEARIFARHALGDGLSLVNAFLRGGHRMTNPHHGRIERFGDLAVGFRQFAGNAGC